jgi:hypothetical protein
MIPLIKRSLGVKDICEQIDLYIGDTELIVGSKGKEQFSCCPYPEWISDDWILEFIENGIWKIGEDGLYHNPPGEEVVQEMPVEDYEAIKSVRP